MILKKRVVLAILSLLLILTGCVFTETKDQKIILQVASNDELPEVSVKQANYTQEYEVVENSIIGTAKAGREYRNSRSSNGIPWLAAKVQEATDAKREVKLIHTYNQFKEKISTIEVPNSEKITEPTGTVYEYGSKPQVGAIWSPNRVTRYGYDCGGCTVNSEGFSGTASGMKMNADSVRQADGTWTKGLTYGGMHVIATSKSIPLCTVVKISNHPFSGGGITANEPFTAIVGNRGVTGSNIDLFAGTETNLNVVNQKGSPATSNTQIEIIGFKTFVPNNGCK